MAFVQYAVSMTYIHRQIEPMIQKLAQSFPSLAVSGPRQSGKSTLLTHTLKDHRYITLDDPLTRERAASDPRFFLDSIDGPVIIDEIQLAPHLLSYIKMRIDKNRDKKGMYVFTGSQQFSMIKDLGDSLAGRIALLDLLPFSAAEKKKSLGKESVLDAFIHAALTGSYPELVVDGNIDVHTWYGSYVRTYLERDIRSIYNIGNLRDFQRFMQLLAGRCSQLLNLSEFAKDIGVSVPTVKNWLSVLEASRMIYLLPPYYNNLGKRITKAPKIYFTDIGIVCYLTGIRDKAHLLQGPMAGALFENYCMQETIKVFFNHGRQPQLYYLRTSNDLEVDLLIEVSARTVLPVEFKSSKTPSPRMGANIERFRKLFSNIEIEKGLLVTMSERTEPLTAELTALSVDDYLKKVAALTET